MPRAPHRRPKPAPEALLNHEVPQPETRCLLCARALGGIVNKHHLLPVSKGGAGTETVLLHKICHDKIHSVLTETQLRNQYHTIERLQAVPELQEFIRWVHNKPPEFYSGTKSRRR